MRARKIKWWGIGVLVIAFTSCEEGTKKEMAGNDVQNRTELLEYVNPLMGTDSDFSLSNGNTYPAIATPWGMNFWTPNDLQNGRWLDLQV